MRFVFALGILIFLFPDGKVEGESSKECKSCSLQWQLAYHHDGNGNGISGSKFSLISAILSGARIRVVIDKYSTEADNVHVLGHHVFAQLLQHVSKASWNKFQDNAYWWWVIMSTNGNMEMTRYNVGSNIHRRTSSKKVSIWWYVQTSTFVPTPSFSHLADGSSVQGNLSHLVKSAKSGYEIRCVTAKKYAFPLQNVAINSQGVSFVSGQNVDSISIKTNGNLIQFQSNVYWWFSVVTTRGLRDMSRWTVGIHQSRGHNQDTVANEWFVDECWKEVFTHDSKGASLSGSRQALTSALMAGHRVRFQIPKWNYYTAEADNLSLRNSHVTAQALKHVSRKGLTGFQDDAYWYWLMVSTTGTVRATRYNVGEHKLRGDSTYKLAVKWFVDTRSWKHVLSNGPTGDILGGDRSDLVQAVRDGRAVRCVQGNECRGYVYNAQNLAVSPDGNHVALNHVSMRSAPDPDEVMISPNAYWWFTIVSTTGWREMSRWTVGEHVDRGHTSDKIGQKWFVNH